MKPVFSSINVYKCLTLLLLSTALTGCGTIINHMGNSDPSYHPGDCSVNPGDPYGGVRFDLWAFTHPHPDGSGIMILDAPASFAADTLMLPYDLSRKH